MNYIKENFNKQPFDIIQYFNSLGVKNRDEANNKFKNAIETIAQYEDNKKNKNIKSFALRIKESNFVLLETNECYTYWGNITRESLRNKRLLAHHQDEESIAETILNDSSKRQKLNLDNINNESVASNIERSPTRSPTRSPARSPTRSLSTSSAVSEQKSVNIWQVWIGLLHSFLSENDISEYSLERLGIVQLGERMGSKQTRSFYPSELTGISNDEIKLSGRKDIFNECSSYHNHIFDLITISIKNTQRKLLESAAEISKLGNSSVDFCHEVYSIFVNQVFTKKGLDEKESTYNFRLVWRLLDAVSNQLPNHEFIPGEIRLQSINQELERQGFSKSSYYNADGIIKDTQFDCELALLETSGPYGLDDKNRETKDYLKATYGLLAMLHSVAHKFHYADINIFKEFKVCFVQAANKKIRVWTFSLCDSKLYVIYRCDSAIVPIDNTCCEENLRKLMNTMWSLKAIINDSSEVLKRLQQSHLTNMRSVSRCLPGHENIKKLESYLEEFAEIKLDPQFNLDTKDLLMYSSPLRPNTPSTSSSAE